VAVRDDDDDEPAEKEEKSSKKESEKESDKKESEDKDDDEAEARSKRLKELFKDSPAGEASLKSLNRFWSEAKIEKMNCEDLNTSEITDWGTFPVRGGRTKAAVKDLALEMKVKKDALKKKKEKC